MKLWLMLKRQEGGGWEVTGNVYFSRKAANEACKRFTDDSMGWKFKPLKFVQA